mmetsp:Transcript_11850/g.21388  ORF Transcript_11850/g.21388 Transcript_11850/m.21388 type:complete len:578 (-) Transcript_11850:678-2411(-)
MAGLQPTEATLQQLNISPLETHDNKPDDDEDATTRRVTTDDSTSSTASSFSKVLNPNAQSFSPSVSSSPSTSMRAFAPPPVVNSPPPPAGDIKDTGPPSPPARPPHAHPTTTTTADFQHAPPTMPAPPPQAAPPPHHPQNAMPPIPWMYAQPPPTVMMDGPPSPPLGMPPACMMPYPHPMEPPPSPSAPPPPMFLQTHAIGSQGQMMRVTPLPPPGQMRGLSPPPHYGWTSYGPAPPRPPPPPPAPPSHVTYAYPHSPQQPAQSLPHPPLLMPYNEYQKEVRSNVAYFVQNALNGAQQGTQRHSMSGPPSHPHQVEGGALPCVSVPPPPPMRRSFDSMYHHHGRSGRGSAGSGGQLPNNNRKHPDAIPERKSCDGRISGRGAKSTGQGSKDGGGYADQQYAFDLTEARRDVGAPPRTTLMIRNIPNKYSQKMLLAMLDKGYSGCYDFFYLPIDFKNRCNLGYAFINFRNGADSAGFYEEFHNKRWHDFNSKKVCEITYARVQGRQALVEHFRNSKFPCAELDYLPLVFELLEDCDDTLNSSETPNSTDGQAPLKMKAVPITLCDPPSGGAINMVTAH